MTYRNKSLASRHVAKKLGAALSSAVLVAPGVMAAVPQVAVAKDEVVTVRVANGLNVSYDRADVGVHLTFGGTVGDRDGDIVVSYSATANEAPGATGCIVGLFGEDGVTYYTKTASAWETMEIVDAQNSGLLDLAHVAWVGTKAKNYHTLTGFSGDSILVEGGADWGSVATGFTGAAIRAGLGDTDTLTIASDYVLTKANLQKVAVSGDDTTKNGNENLADGDGKVTVTVDAKTSVGSGDTVNLAGLDKVTATPAAGYHFVTWSYTREATANAAFANADATSVTDAATGWVDFDSEGSSPNVLSQAQIAKMVDEASTANFGLRAVVAASSYQIEFDAGEGTISYANSTNASTLKKTSSSKITVTTKTGDELDDSKTNLDVSVASPVDLDGTNGGVLAEPKAGTADSFLGWAAEDGTVIVNSNKGIFDATAQTALQKIVGNKTDQVVKLHALYGRVISDDELAADPGVNLVFSCQTIGTDGLAMSNGNTGGQIRGVDGSAANSVTEKLATSGSGATKVLTEKSVRLNDNYTFDGWYKKTSDGVTTTYTLVTTSTTITAAQQYDALSWSGSGTNQKVAATELVARFRRGAVQSFTVVYDGNGATLRSGVKTPANATVTLDGVADKALTKDDVDATWVKTGYVALADADGTWNTKADGTGTAVKGGANLEALGAKAGETVTLYAQWQLGSGNKRVDFKAGDKGTLTVTNTSGTVVSDGVSEAGDTITATHPLTFSTVKAVAKQGYSATDWKVEEFDEDMKLVSSKTVKAVNGTTLSASDFTGDTLTRAIINANTDSLASAKHTYVFTANFRAWNYSALFDGAKQAYTVGVAATLPEGDWYDAKGNKVSTKAELDALVARDGDAVVLTSKSTVKAGWYKDADGDYHYATAVVDGERVDAKGWSRGGTTKYYYYFDKTTGKMKKNAWVKDGGYWYHFGPRGAMEHDKPIAYRGVNYWLNSRGAAIKA